MLWCQWHQSIYSCRVDLFYMVPNNLNYSYKYLKKKIVNFKLDFCMSFTVYLITAFAFDP